MTYRKILIGFIAAVAALSQARTALSQDFPSRPVKVVVPNPPGGPGDVIARAFTDRLGKKLSQPFVLEYRAGASTTIGTLSVVKADPDGHTILALPSSGLAVTLVRKKLPYNLETDLRPITGIGSVPLALLVRASLGLKTIDDLTAAARAGKLFYGSGGVGTVGHLTGLSLLSELKGTATHVPYRGNPEVMQAMLGGTNDFFFGSIADAVAFARQPEIQVLGVTSETRVPGLEGVPTMSELGLPKIDAKLWYAFMAPAQTPTDRVMLLHKNFEEIAKDPELQQQVGKFGFKIEIRNPEQLAAMMKTQSDRWKQLVEANNVSIND